MGFFENSGMNADRFNVTFQHGIQFRYNDMYSLFRNCSNFNSPVAIPDNVTTLGCAFENCPKFNSNVFIDPYNSHLRSMTACFNNSNKFQKNLNIPYGYNQQLYYPVHNDYTGTFHVYSRGRNPSVDGYFNEFFYGCNANFNVEWHTEPINLYRAFDSCTRLNRNINIPTTVRDVSRAFSSCWNLNKNIRLHDRTFAAECSYDCYNLNQNIRIPRLGIISRMFYYCINLNQPMYVPEVNGNDYLEQRNNIVQLFYVCRNLNSVITLDTNLKSLAGIFDSCMNFNQPVTIPNNVQDVAGMFKSCYNFDQPIDLPDGIIDMDSTFDSCINFTHHVRVPSSVRHMNATFHGTKISSPTVIPVGVEYLTSTFSGCSLLDGAPVIPSSVISMRYTFSGCTNFTTPIDIPDSVTDMTGCFSSCINLRELPIIPSSVTSLSYCFSACNNLNVPIVIPNDCSVYNMLYNATNYRQPVTVNMSSSEWYSGICDGAPVPTLTLSAPKYDWTRMRNMWNVHHPIIHEIIANTSPNSVIFNLRLNGSADYPTGQGLTLRDYFTNDFAAPNMLGISNIYRSPRSYDDYQNNYAPRNYSYGGCTAWFNNFDDGGMHAVYYDYPNCNNAEDVSNHAYFIRMYLI